MSHCSSLCDSNVFVIFTLISNCNRNTSSASKTTSDVTLLITSKRTQNTLNQHVSYAHLWLKPNKWSIHKTYFVQKCCQHFWRVKIRSEVLWVRKHPYGISYVSASVFVRVLPWNVYAAQCGMRRCAKLKYLTTRPTRGPRNREEPICRRRRRYSNTI